MILKGWLQEAEKKIYSLDAELIACYALGFEDRVELVLHGEDDFDMKKADELVEKRAAGVPLAYLTGKKEFFGRDFKVDKNVLIPRPETEDIILSVLSIVETDQLKNLTILDVGTGSGCIPITLKLELDAIGVDAKIFASDISKPALKIASENAEALNATVSFVYSDLLAKFKTLPDILIANLPYVDKSWDWTSDSLKFEPALALYADNKGLKIIKRLLDEINDRKDKKRHFLLLEADPSQHQDIIDYAKKRGINLILKNNFILVFHT